MRQRLLLALALLSCGLPAAAQVLRYQPLPAYAQLPEGVSLTALLQDSEGFVWYGTSDGRVVRNDAYSLVCFIGTDSDEAGETTNNRTTALAEDVDGHVWAGFDKGLCRIDKTNGYAMADIGADSIVSVNCICATRGGDVWVAANDKLRRFGSDGQFQQGIDIDLDGRELFAYDMVEGGNGNLYVAVSGYGLGFVRPGDKQITSIPWPYTKEPTALCVDTVHHCLWIGTSGEGIVQWSDARGDYLRMFDSMGDDGVDGPKSMVNQLQFDRRRNMLWETTMGGVYAYEIEADELHPFPLNRLVPNYPHDACLAQIDRQGNVWVSPSDGQLYVLCSSAASDHAARGFRARVVAISVGEIVNYVDFNGKNQLSKPQELKLSKIPDEIDVDGRVHAAEMLLTLTTFDMLNAWQSRLSYSLRRDGAAAGPDEEWVELPVGINKVSLSQLEAGEYELYVRTSQADGTWSEDELCATLTITDAAADARAGWSFRRLVVWLFGGLVVWLFLGLVVWFFRRPIGRWVRVGRTELAARLASCVARAKSALPQAASHPEEDSSEEQAASEQAEEHNERDEQFVQQVRSIVMAHLGNAAFGVAELSRELSMSRVHLHRRLQQADGRKPNELIRDIRLEEAARLLSTTSLSVTEVSERAGFGTPRYFSQCFRTKYGVLPKKYQLNKK